MTEISDDGAFDGPEVLTAREREILDSIAQGLQDKMIAASLSISEETVGSHTKKIFRKLGVRNRTQAALVYRQEQTVSEVGLG